jgi:hypothetical protein
VVVLKGPELARRYPEEGIRPYRDLDLLAAEPREVQQALLADGWQRLRDEDVREDLQHDDPLIVPGLPLPVEVHRRPKWPSWSPGPRAEELLEVAVRAPGAPEGVLVLPLEFHAVLVAVHAWAHRPLRRILDLVDVAVLSPEAVRAEQARIATRWGVGRLWQVTIRAADALLREGPRSIALSTWARGLPAVRERRPVEAALERWTAPLAERPPREALAESARAIARDALGGRATLKRRGSGTSR